MNIQDYDREVEILNDADKAYWIDNKPTMPDAEFDKRLAALKEYETANDTVNPESPTQRLGGGLIKGFKKVPHITPMLSLSNIFSVDDLESQLTGIMTELQAGPYSPDPGKTLTWSVESKVDGLSCELRYVKGMLVQALTRGTGEIGDDVTENVKTIRNVPLSLATRRDFRIRGEVFMPFKTFEKLNAAKKEAGEPLLANPRNAAAGALKLLDSREVAKRGLSFVPYWSDMTDCSQAGLRDRLECMGFSKLEMSGDFLTIQETIDYVIKFEALKRKLPYPTDGAVIKIGTTSLRRHFPDGSKSVNWAWAYKYAPDQAETRLESVTFQVGRTGIIAPVAELTPVEVAGSTVARATLHNEDNIIRLGLRLGDTVTIEKCGEVIPGMVGVVLSARTGQEKPIVWPKVCPSCGAKIVKVMTEDGEGAAWQCNGTECPAKLQGNLEHWCSKKALDIQDVGPAFIEKLVNAGIGDVGDLYDITYESLRTLPGVGDTSAKNALNQIGASKTQGLERVLIGLGIHRLGEGSSKRLCKHFKDWDSLTGASDEELLSVTDFGEVNLREFRKWCSISDNIELMKRLRKSGVNMESKSYNPNAAAGSLSGKTFVFTGTLSTMGRSQAEKMVEEKGAKASGSVSKNTSFLIAGEDCGSKLDKAKTLGVTVMTEKEFIEMMEEC